MNKRISLAVVPLAATVACSAPATLQTSDAGESGTIVLEADSGADLSDIPVGTPEGRLAEQPDGTLVVPDALRSGFDALAASNTLAGSAMASWLRARSQHPELGRTAQNTGVRRFLIQARRTKAVPALPGWRILAQQPLLHAVIATPEDPRALQDLLARTLAHPDLANVEEESVRKTAAAPTDPQYSSLWAWPKIKAALAHDRFASTPGTLSVAVLDTGVQLDHQDLSGNTIAREPGDNLTTDADGAVHPHGTHVAGTIAAVRDNGLGVVGIAPQANILDVKVLGDRGNGYSSWVASGIVRAVDRGARVINLSLGSTSYSDAERTAIDYALTRGVLVVAAAGNSNTMALHYPAAYSGVLSVMASTPSDTRASFSNYGTWCHLAAPGTSILSTVPVSTYGTLQGTSMACPHVAGAAAVVLQAADQQGTTLRPPQVHELLRTTGQALPRFWGSATVPRLDLDAAVQQVLNNNAPPDRPASVTLSKPVVTANAATLPFSASEMVKVRLWTLQNGNRLVPGGPAPGNGGWLHDNPYTSRGQAVMSGLRPDTVYAYQLEAEDAAAQQTVSDVGTFRTLPFTLGLAATSATNSSINVSLSRNVSSISGLTMWVSPTNWTTTPPGDATSSALADDAPGFSVANLLPNKTYYMQIEATEGVANTTSKSAVFGLKTAPLPLTITSTSVTRTSVTLNFTSTVAGFGGIKYGSGTKPRSFSTLYSNTSGTNHSVTVTGLRSNSAYVVTAVLRQSHSNEAGLSRNLSVRTSR
ncbi:MAG: S8 family serine peptidase [Candidatus Sericytochromatia bacterium]|nr:S8 family serine peptidase [Candidatus Sericytochromatia bacterium]